jgi:hypothetical protein
MAMSNSRNGVNVLFGSTVQYQGNRELESCTCVCIGRAIESWRVELSVKNAVNVRLVRQRLERNEYGQQ